MGGQDATGHPSEGSDHRKGAWMWILDVQSPVGHRLPGGRVSLPLGSGVGQGGCRPNQEPDGGTGHICGNRPWRRVT